MQATLCCSACVYAHVCPDTSQLVDATSQVGIPAGGAVPNARLTVPLPTCCTILQYTLDSCAAAHKGKKQWQNCFIG